MRIKELKVCKKCDNKSALECPVCGKRRSQILFELACIKKHKEFLARIHWLLKKYNMESTGSATMDLEVLDNCGVWIPILPRENPLYNFYERLKASTVLEIHHLCKFMQVNFKEFLASYQTYLATKAIEIRRVIEQNKLDFIE